MRMAQQFDYLKTETELREILDELYATSKNAYEKGKRPSIKGLVEIITTETTIVTAIHNIKSNKGSKTHGADNKTMQEDYLQKPFKWVIKDIQNAFVNYKPQKIRRVYIDKPGKTEKRPLGIPTIRDRIMQECIRIVLEPILEAQFYKHSYGFRPMRDTQMALEQLTNYVHKTGYHWVVEGDISKCFDKINHGILIKRLYHIGIKDKRVLQIIKAMLKAGVIGEEEVNEEGVMQGGILSPLLSNTYLDIFDEWLSKQWGEKKTRHDFTQISGKFQCLRKFSNLKPAYLVRYADDFVVITDSRDNARWWKKQIQEFLWNQMKLNLSKEKTLITDVRKEYIHFLGYQYKVVKGKALKGYIPRTLPDKDRLERKVNAIVEEIKLIPLNYSREQAVHEINLINSKLRGLINYYDNCTWVSIAMNVHSRRVCLTAMRWLKRYKGKWIPAKQTQNLISVHKDYNQKIPAMKYGDIWIGVTALNFCKWELTPWKKPEETPYTEVGRQIYFNRTKKKRRNARLDDLLSLEVSDLIAKGRIDKSYNFEYFMNRAYTLNRDRLKCRVCGQWLYSGLVYTHRINPYLSMNKINKVANLVSMDSECYRLVNNPNTNIEQLDAETRKKIENYRKRLVKIHAK